MLKIIFLSYYYDKLSSAIEIYFKELSTILAVFWQIVPSCMKLNNI